MPVPSAITDLSQTAGSNSPAGSESPTTTDDYLRAQASFIALLRDGKGHSAEVDLASAATCDIGGQDSFFVRITGTTTITSFGTNYNGPRFIRFAAALTLTHNASTLILPGGANITTAASDAAVVTPISGGWVVNQYIRADGKVVIGALTSGTTVAATSGTSIDFTSIPSWVKRVTLNLAGVSVSGSSNPLIQIGDSGGVETSGYLGSGTSGGNAQSPSVANYTTGFGLNTALAANTLHGSITLSLLDSGTNTWTCSGSLSTSNAAAFIIVSGSKPLSATMDRVRLTTVNGTDTFDAGSVNILYE